MGSNLNEWFDVNFIIVMYISRLAHEYDFYAW